MVSRGGGDPGLLGVTRMDNIAMVIGFLCCGLPILGVVFWLADIFD